MGVTPEFSRAAAEDICFKAQSAGATRRAVDAGGRGRAELGTAALRGPPKDEGEGELQEKAVWRWPFSYHAKREDVDAFSQEMLAEMIVTTSSRVSLQVRQLGFIDYNGAMHP
jgi:hypothetical protein